MARGQSANVEALHLFSYNFLRTLNLSLEQAVAPRLDR